MTSIDGRVFKGCSALKSVLIGNSVESIGEEAFSGCTGLTSITIPNSVTSIGNSAFAECSIIRLTVYATTPPSGGASCGINAGACTLYVPEESIDLYRAADGWKDFANIQAIQEPKLQECTILYVDKDEKLVSSENLTFHVPAAPEFEGFTFQYWQTTMKDISDGIINIQAVYEYNGVPTSAPEVYTNPANPAQKLIRNGNVYILTGDKTYTITGQMVK